MVLFSHLALKKVSIKDKIHYFTLRDPYGTFLFIIIWMSNSPSLCDTER